VLFNMLNGDTSVIHVEVKAMHLVSEYSCLVCSLSGIFFSSNKLNCSDAPISIGNHTHLSAIRELLYE